MVELCITHLIILYNLCSIKFNFSYIMSLITWCSYTRYMFTLMTLLVLNGYLAEKQGPTEKVKQTVRIRFVYVVIFHTQISTRIDRERLYRISLKLIALQHIFCSYYIPSFRTRGIQFYRPFVKKWFSYNNIKTSQHNHFKIIVWKCC